MNVVVRKEQRLSLERMRRFVAACDGIRIEIESRKQARALMERVLRAAATHQPWHGGADPIAVVLSGEDDRAQQGTVES